jgi:hypothetical protein
MQITMYDTWENMIEAMQRASREADARVKPWQREIKVGDCFVQQTEYGFPIFGEVLATYQERHLKHYRFCFCFSEACPEGEKGDVHTSVITSLIDEAAFKAMHRKLNKPA